MASQIFFISDIFMVLFIGFDVGQMFKLSHVGRSGRMDSCSIAKNHGYAIKFKEIMEDWRGLAH
jgi:hypothetical protein